MSLSFRTLLIHAFVVGVTAVVASPSSAAGRIDANTVIAIPHGAFNGVQYKRYEAMFAGVTSNRDQPDNFLRSMPRT